MHTAQPTAPGEFGLGGWSTINGNLHAQAMEALRAVESRRRERPTADYAEYFLVRCEDRVRTALQQAGLNEAPALAFVDRAKFNADVCVTVPTLLKTQGSKEYIQSTIPRIAEAIRRSPLLQEGLLADVDTKGIYVNLKVSDRFLLTVLEDVQRLKRLYGTNRDLHGQVIVVDYSSPNVAKKLHAGHIRSTILGEVLCNLYEACGATVHRLNHLNDLGGFGNLLEGYRRWAELLSPDKRPNDRLAELYLLYRTLEKVVDEGKEPSGWSEEQRSVVTRCFGPNLSRDDVAGRWSEFVGAANKQFEALEQGAPEQLALWQQMVAWSLEDFGEFYHLLGIRHDYNLGESFYLPGGLRLIEAALASGKAKKFSAQDVAREVARLDTELQAERIQPREHEQLVSAVRADEGAVVVELSNNQRLVVLRSDGRTIYATRDLGAIQYRTTYFKPTRMVYAVGQEQQDHFKGVFEAASTLGVDGGTLHSHIYFGFYVDGATKKKFSSRAGAASVVGLLEGTIKHFESKFMSDGQLPTDEAQRAAHQLGVGSIILNDIKKDKKNNVDIFVDLQRSVEEFERSGGAYIMYTACRAASIVRKYGKAVPAVSSLDPVVLDPSEAELIKRIADLPQRARSAALQDDPSLLVQALFELSRLYNTYYNAFPVLKGGEVHAHRLILTEAVSTALRNGLALCHIDCPERI